MPTNHYEVPPWGSSGDRILGWLLEAVQEGEGWLQAQRPAAEWEKVLQTLGPDMGTDAVEGLSNTGYNKCERMARELVASLSNFRHEGEFDVRFNQQLYNQAHALTELDRNWYDETDAYGIYRQGLQYAVGLGTGYYVEDWDKSYWGTHGDIRLRAFGPQDITFVQLPKDHDIQKAYVVLIREELPINLARATYPNIADQLQPDRDQPGWLQKGLEKLQRLMGGSPALRVAGTSGRQQQGSFPTVDIFHAYIMDRRANAAPVPMQMGAYDTNWTYRVPALGDPVPLGIINPATGAEFTRPATAQDAKLFPLRRYCVFSRTAVSYDGSSPWWHGAVPVARVRFNDWAWEALGQSLIANPRTMQDGITALMRYIEDSCAARLDPPVLYDDQVVSEGFAKAFNPRMAGSRAAASFQLGEPLKYPIPPEYYNVPAVIPEWIREQEARMDYLTSTPDLVAIAKAKQVPGEGTLEKLQEMAGPLVQDLIRNMEAPLRHLGEWRKSYYFQFYTYPRMISVVGPEIAPSEDPSLAFAAPKRQQRLFQPSELVPDQTGETTEARIARAKAQLAQYKYTLTESGINEIHRMVNKLAYLQLVKAGVPLSWWTLAQVWQIPNFGPPPEGTHTEMERWIAQKHIEIELQIELQSEVAKATGAAPGGDATGMPAAPEAPAAPSQNGPGRPQSFQRAPRLVSKDGGTRSTVTTAE